jgi:hypothetical protein
MAPIFAEMRAEERRREREAIPPPADKSTRPTREELMARYPDLVIGSKFDAARYPPKPTDYSDKPCTLSPQALAIMGKGE